MARTYIRLHRSFADHEKWIDLSVAGRAGWAELAMRADDDGRLRSQRSAQKLLERAGIGNAPAVMAELLELRLVDEDPAGGLQFHDWPDHQPTYRGPSDEPEAVAERKRRQRAPGSNVTSLSGHVTNGHEPTRAVAIDSTQLNSIPFNSTQPHPTRSHSHAPAGARGIESDVV